MNLKINKEKIKSFRINKDIISLFVLIIFLCASWFILDGVKVVDEDIPNYSELTKNPDDNFQNLAGKTDLKDIIETEQFKDLKYEDNLIKEYEKKIERNLFEKTF